MSEELKEIREAIALLADTINDFSRAMGHHVAPERQEIVLKALRSEMRELSEKMQKANGATHE